RHPSHIVLFFSIHAPAPTEPYTLSLHDALPIYQVWLADLTTSLMKEGTISRSAQQVAQEAASMGGSVDVSVGPDITRIDGDVLSDRKSTRLTPVTSLSRMPSSA